MFQISARLFDLGQGHSGPGLVSRTPLGVILLEDRFKFGVDPIVLLSQEQQGGHGIGLGSHFMIADEPIETGRGYPFQVHFGEGILHRVPCF